MFRLVMLLIVVVGVLGCTQVQRFKLSRDAVLDKCAMKRMSETKISGQQGYLQAHYECHQIVVIQKGIELNLVSKPEYGARWQAKDPIEEHAMCWELVKDLYVNEHYPELRRRPKRDGRLGKLSRSEWLNQVTVNNSKVRPLPDKLNQLTREDLIEISELMAGSSLVLYKEETLCSPSHYPNLESIIGREANQRHLHSGENKVGGVR